MNTAKEQKSNVRSQVTKLLLMWMNMDKQEEILEGRFTQEDVERGGAGGDDE